MEDSILTQDCETFIALLACSDIATRVNDYQGKIWETDKKDPASYLMWSDDNRIAEKTAVNLPYIAAPKQSLPGHEQSYNPPTEYLLSAEEEAAAKRDDENPFLPKLFDSLRKVPAYDRFIHECFERCLDLYLCPRTRKNRVTLDPVSLFESILVL